MFMYVGDEVPKTIAPDGLEAKIAESQQIVESQRLFFANMLHDMRTPLSTVSQLLLTICAGVWCACLFHVSLRKYMAF